MTRHALALVLAFSFSPAFSLPAFAGDACCPSQAAAAPGTMAAAGNPQAGMAMAGETGSVRIHEGKKDGFSLAFELLPMKGEGITHHLMVFVKDAAGKPLVGAKVGFDVASPVKGSRDQKVMAMGMGDGYGANLDLTAKGKYTIKTRVVGGGKDILYTFEHEVR